MSIDLQARILTVAALLSSSACVGERLATDGLDETDETASGSEDGDGTSDGTSDGSELDPDEQLCLDWCLSGAASDCPSPWSGVLCYTRCMDLELAADSPCSAEQREVIACEAGVSSRTEPACESLDCSDAYKRDDLCRGWCTHLGGIPGAGASADECDWRSDCYGFELETRCSVGDDPANCECLVDGEVVAQCEQPELQAFACEPSIHVLTSCCADTFEAVLLP